jgi:STE24 endopeptidase
MESTILIIIITIVLFNYLFGLFLDYLDTRYWSSELPADLANIYDKEKYAKSQAYEKETTRFSWISGTFSTLILLLVLIYGMFGVVDSYLRLQISSPLFISLVFFAIIGFASDLIGIPFDIYSTFHIEQKYGFNTTTVKTYILDKIKSWLLALLLGGVIVGIIVWIFNETGPAFWYITWLFLTAFTLFMSLFYSSLIVPLFNKQKPLEEGELRTAIHTFADRAGFSIKNIFVIDGSKRSKKANAYFTGWGAKKRIVLYDTLINDLSIDEVVAVLAHEIGHYKKKHVIFSLVTSILSSGLLLFIMSFFLHEEIFSLAIGGKIRSFHLGILAFGLLYSPFSLVLGIFGNYFSRKHEYAADRFVCEHQLGNDLKSGLIRLSVSHLSNLRPHPWNVKIKYSHPTLLQRIFAIENFQVK